MASKGKKKKLKESDSDVFIPVEEPPKSAVAGWLFRPAVLLLGAIAVAAAVFGPRAANWLPDLPRRAEYRVKAGDIRITETPPWVPASFLRQVAREGGLGDELSLLDDGIVDKVAAAFQKHPWVERVVAVHKDLRTGIDVELVYRKPAAIVVADAARYPIDSHGVLLPPCDGPLNVLPITNARSTPQGPPGTDWGDRTIEGAARIADVLGSTWRKLQIESIRIPDASTSAVRPDDTIYELVAVGGSRIIWGRAPGSKHPGELTPEQKIGRIEEYSQRHGGFNDAHGPYEIDIRHWQDITLRPLGDRPDLEPR